MKRIVFIFLVLMSFVLAVPTAIQMDFLMSGVMDTTGRPLAGGKVYFYVNDGGTTTKAIYASSIILSANILASPLSLNDSGVPRYLPYGYGVYRVVIKDRTGLTKYTYTNISYGVGNAQTGVTDVRQVYGSNDSAIASAILAAGTSPNAILLFTPGEYTIGNTQTFPTNIALEFQPGAYLNIATAVEVIVSGSIIAEAQRIKTGAGTLTISSANNPIIYEVWRENGNKINIDSTIENTLKLEATIYSTGDVYSVGNIKNIGKLVISGNVYITGSISITGNIGITGNINVSGDISITGKVSISGNIYANTISVNSLSTNGNENVKFDIISTAVNASDGATIAHGKGANIRGVMSGYSTDQPGNTLVINNIDATNINFTSGFVGNATFYFVIVYI